jgi:hypothetical protein
MKRHYFTTPLLQYFTNEHEIYEQLGTMVIQSDINYAE